MNLTTRIKEHIISIDANINDNMYIKNAQSIF